MSDLQAPMAGPPSKLRMVRIEQKFDMAILVHQKTSHRIAQKMNKFTRLKGTWDDLCPFQITSIRDDFDGLNVSVEDNRAGTNKGNFYIDAHHAYRNFNEADLAKYWDEIGGVKSTGLYVSNVSSLMQWAANQCIDEALDPLIKHYMIVSVEDIFEVLAFDEPKFTLESE